MRALRVVGIGQDGEVVLEDSERQERFVVACDERLRAAARGDVTRLGQIAIESENPLRPREIQARIRAGASVEQVADLAGLPLQRIERFAYPILLERSRTAELAQRAHPVRADGPDPRTLAEVVSGTFSLRSQDYDEAEWDSWRGEDGKWVVALSWRAGRSENRAHWGYHPGAHGGTVTVLDEYASDLVDGLPAKPLRTVGPVIELPATTEPESEPEPAPEPVESVEPAPGKTKARPATATESQQSQQAAGGETAAAEPAAAGPARRDRKGKPVMPSWEDVLLGVRGQR